MAKPENYKQCEVTRIVYGGAHPRALREVSWVPTKFAKVGKSVTIDGMDGTWTVTSVYDLVRTREQLDIERGAQKDVASVLEPHT